MRSHVPIKGQPLLEPCTDEKRSIRKVLIRIRIRVYNYKLPYNRDNNGSPFIMDSVRFCILSDDNHNLRISRVLRATG